MNTHAGLEPRHRDGGGSSPAAGTCVSGHLDRWGNTAIGVLQSRTRGVSASFRFKPAQSHQSTVRKGPQGSLSGVWAARASSAGVIGWVTAEVDWWESIA
jgi:hypothetical protein